MPHPYASPRVQVLTSMRNPLKRYYGYGDYHNMNANTIPKEVVGTEPNLRSYWQID